MITHVITLIKKNSKNNNSIWKIYKTGKYKNLNNFFIIKIILIFLLLKTNKY